MLAWTVKWPTRRGITDACEEFRYGITKPDFKFMA